MAVHAVDSLTRLAGGGYTLSGCEASGSFALRDPNEYRLEFAETADGDGRGEVILHYLSLTEASRSVFDILRLR